LKLAEGRVEADSQPELRQLRGWGVLLQNLLQVPPCMGSRVFGYFFRGADGNNLAALVAPFRP